MLYFGESSGMTHSNLQVFCLVAMEKTLSYFTTSSLLYFTTSMGLVFGVVTTLVVDMAFLIQVNETPIDNLCFFPALVQ